MRNIRNEFNNNINRKTGYVLLAILFGVVATGIGMIGAMSHAKFITNRDDRNKNNSGSTDKSSLSLIESLIDAKVVKSQRHLEERIQGLEQRHLDARIYRLEHEVAILQKHISKLEQALNVQESRNRTNNDNNNLLLREVDDTSTVDDLTLLEPNLGHNGADHDNAGDYVDDDDGEACSFASSPALDMKHSTVHETAIPLRSDNSLHRDRPRNRHEGTFAKKASSDTIPNNNINEIVFDNFYTIIECVSAALVHSVGSLVEHVPSMGISGILSSVNVFLWDIVDLVLDSLVPATMKLVKDGLNILKKSLYLPAFEPSTMIVCILIWILLFGKRDKTVMAASDDNSEAGDEWNPPASSLNRPIPTSIRGSNSISSNNSASLKQRLRQARAKARQAPLGA